MYKRTIGVAYNGYIGNCYPDSSPTPLDKPNKKQAIAYAQSLTPNKLGNFDWECGYDDDLVYRWELGFREVIYVDIERERPFSLEQVVSDDELNTPPVLANKDAFNSIFFARNKTSKCSL